MTYCSIDRQRFTYLLKLGTDEFELRKFFADNRVQLIQRGAKVQNLPHGHATRIRVIVNELPMSTDEVLRNWFSENLSMSDPETPEKIIETFKLHEEMEESPDETLARRLARSCLVHIFGESPSTALLEFLRSPIGGIEAKTRRDAADAMTLDPPSKPFLDSEKLASVLVALIQGQDVDKYLEGLPRDVAGLVAGLQAGAKGRLKEAHDSLEGLSVGSHSHAALKQFLEQQAARPLKANPQGAVVMPFETFSGPFEYETDEVLAYCTNAASANAVFVQPMAVLRAGKAQRLTNEARRELFPVNGDVMAFPGQAYPRQPHRGEVGAWRVEEHPTEKATHFHLKVESRKVYEVFNVPFPSTDYDSVREFLKEHAETRGAVQLQQPLFVLRDGLLVGGRAEKPDLAKDDTYEAGLLSWNALAVVALEGRMFCVGPLPKEHGIYECASIGVSIRKLLRPYMGSGKAPVGLTRAQLSELVQFLTSHESDLTPARMQRIRSELGHIGETQEGLEALAQELLAHPLVKERVEHLVREAAQKQNSEKAEIQGDIARLKKERDEWNERIHKQKEEHRSLRENTVKVVRAAFEKARTDSVGTLAELAVFQGLTGGVNQGAGHLAPQPSVREFTKVSTGVAPILQQFGVSPRKASAFAAVGQLAASLGLILCVRGMASRLVVEQWAQTIGKGILIDANIGLVDDGPLKGYFNGTSQPEVVAILDANLSALDIYARPISDAVMGALVKGGAEPPTAVLFSLTESVGQLPLPRSIEGLSVSLDLDGKYDFDAIGGEDAIQRAFDPEEGVLTTKLWRPASEKLRKYIADLDDEAQRFILAVLAAS